MLYAFITALLATSALWVAVRLKSVGPDLSHVLDMTTTAFASVDDTYTNATVYGYIYCDGTVGRNVVLTLIQATLSLPAGELDAFVADGWRITLTGHIDADAPDTTTDTICGLTDFAGKTIYVDVNSADIASTALHEFGHVADKRLGWPSSADEFTRIFEAHKADYARVSAHGASSCEEFFADMFADMAQDHADERYQDAYDYIERAVSADDKAA